MSDAPSTPSTYSAPAAPEVVSVTFEMESDEMPRLLMGMTLRNAWKVAVALFVGILAYEAIMLAGPESPDWLRFATRPVAGGLFALGVAAWVGWRQGARYRDSVPVYQDVHLHARACHPSRQGHGDDL